MSTTGQIWKPLEVSCDLDAKAKIDQPIAAILTASDQKKPPWPITTDGIWVDKRMAPLAKTRPALFLDRDGVVVRDTGFLSNPDSVTIIPETAALMRRANLADVPVLVVTNQSGIDRGLLGWDDFAAVEAAIAGRLAALGARSDATAACPFHPDHTAGYGDDHARWRKPGPGLIIVLAEELGITLSESWLIGDRPRDIDAARNAGLAGGILIDTGATEEDGLNTGQPNFAAFTEQIADSAAEAAERILATGLFAIP